ncbi:MAG: hypothetical protein JW894_10755 [Bacteroidales bacterium]|nr:hypothetical protein [Bacteroidales bacterium]
MNNKALVEKIYNTILEAQSGYDRQKIIYTNNVQGNNEFLFFVKPELTIKSGTIQLKKILEFIFEKFLEFEVSVRNIILQPAKYLEKNNIIAQHYGVINAIARDAKTNLSESIKNKISRLFNIPFDSANVMGGLELQKKYPELSASAIDYIWQNSPVIKLGGGAYGQSLKIDGKQIYLINGFHPRQLEHFIASGRSIVTFTLTGDLDWGVARNNLIGKTNPAEATEGSIRKSLLNRKEEFGLQTVSSSWNGVHLSAGPVEGLLELIRYNSNFDTKEKLDIQDFAFGRLLAEVFSPDITEKILSNQTVSLNSDNISIFDLTEEKNANEAVELLKKVFRK